MCVSSEHRPGFSEKLGDGLGGLSPHFFLQTSDILVVLLYSPSDAPVRRVEEALSEQR